MVQILDEGITRPLELAGEKREGFIGTHDMSGPQKDFCCHLCNWHPSKTQLKVHSRKLTWNLIMMISTRNLHFFWGGPHFQVPRWCSGVCICFVCHSFPHHHHQPTGCFPHFLTVARLDFLGGNLVLKHPRYVWTSIQNEVIAISDRNLLGITWVEIACKRWSFLVTHSNFSNERASRWQSSHALNCMRFIRISHPLALTLSLQMILGDTRWVPTSYTYSYNPYKRPYKWCSWGYNHALLLGVP